MTARREVNGLTAFGKARGNSLHCAAAAVPKMDAEREREQ
jgi:hypothetical protein